MTGGRNDAERFGAVLLGRKGMTDAYLEDGAAGCPGPAQHVAGPCLSAAMRADPERRDRARAARHHPGARRRVRRQRHAGARGLAAADSGASADGHLRPLDRRSASVLRAPVPTCGACGSRSSRSRCLGNTEHRQRRDERLQECVTAMEEAVRSGDNKQYLR